MSRVFLLGKKFAVEIPFEVVKHQGITEGQELQFDSKDIGLIVVSVKNNVVSKNSVLKELQEIPLEKRVVKDVLESFSLEKRKIFALLVMEDKVVISDKYFNVPSVVVSFGSNVLKNQPIDSFDYLIIKDESEARKVSDNFSEEILSGKIIGVRGFDSNFYIVKSSVFKKISLKITEIMCLGITDFNGLLEKISDKDLLKAVIEIMKDKGLVIEKHNGLFALV